MLLQILYLSGLTWLFLAGFGHICDTGVWAH